MNRRDDLQLREFADECFQLAALTVDIARKNLAVGDDVGLEYATRRLIAYVRAAAATVRDIRPVTADKVPDHKLEQELTDEQPVASSAGDVEFGRSDSGRRGPGGDDAIPPDGLESGGGQEHASGP